MVPDFAVAPFLGHDDLTVSFVDIQPNILISVHVLVLAFGCFGSHHIQVDRLHSGGVTHVDGDKHPNAPLLSTQL